MNGDNIIKKTLVYLNISMIEIVPDKIINNEISAERIIDNKNEIFIGLL